MITALEDDFDRSSAHRTVRGLDETATKRSSNSSCVNLGSRTHDPLVALRPNGRMAGVLPGHDGLPCMHLAHMGQRTPEGPTCRRDPRTLSDLVDPQIWSARP
jgi:hypothetical protein